MWTGYIMNLWTEPETGPVERWVVELQVEDGRIFHDYTTEAMYNQLDYGMLYTMGQTEIPPQPEQ